jgi:hypothetical protein
MPPPRPPPPPLLLLRHHRAIGGDTAAETAARGLRKLWARPTGGRRRPADELAGGAPPGAARVLGAIGVRGHCVAAAAAAAAGEEEELRRDYRDERATGKGGRLIAECAGGRTRSCGGDRRRDARTAGGRPSGRAVPRPGIPRPSAPRGV